MKRAAKKTGHALDALVAALRSPVCYPHPVRSVRVIETHISWVLLTGEFAYKLKKPVDLGFLDFTTLGRRRHYCEEEVRLNRRTAPELYLAVVAITGSIASPRVEAGGEGAAARSAEAEAGGKGAEAAGRHAIEYAVKMRQFDPRASFDALAAGGGLGGSRIDALAATVAAFHGRIAVAGADVPYGDLASVAAPMHANFEDLRESAAGEDRARVDRLAGWTAAALERRSALIEGRRREGRVRECHGDLHLGNVALIADRPVLFDCIEFSAELRWIDVMSDVAFAFMDLLEHRLPGAGWRFLSAYFEVTGDYGGAPLQRLYAVYRALVRAKVALLRAHQSGEGSAETARGLARFGHLLALAERMANDADPRLIVTCGLSGSGKTTVAQFLLEDLGAIRVRSDVERKRLFGRGATADASAPAELYGAQATASTYERLAEIAAGLLSAGECAIVDATFLQRAERERFRRLAGQQGVPFSIVSCRAPAQTLRERVAARHAQGRDASDADLAVLEQQLAAAELPESDESGVIEIDTGKPRGEVAQACAALVAGWRQSPRVP